MSHVKPLIVDLDTSLLRTDLAREEFWRVLGDGGWRTLLSGAPKATSYLRHASAADLAKLPMTAAVVEAMRDARAAGRRVVLVTHAPDELARRFADALDIVDEAVGDAPAGADRAAWLASRFDGAGVEYVAGASAAPTGGIAPYIKALRPHQWVKNLLVFLPMIAAHRFDFQTLALTLIAFAAFCLVASSVYILNDLLDLSSDRAHPRKRFRPMASGAVPLAHAGVLALVCLVAGLGLALFAGSQFVAALCGYTILTTVYSLRLKREPILDVCVLAALYTLRIVAGAAATGIVLSVWLLAFSIFIFLSLAAIKRQTELVDNLQSGRDKPAGRGYRVVDLPIVEMMSVAAGYVAVLVLALYLNATTVAGLYATPEILWVVCAVLLYWISRVVMIAHRGEMHDDPIVFALRDRISHVCGVVIVIALAAATWW
ncbi:MAG: UbiA family prenyltransferase [Beijerinckiaceae bacterium]|nr:UbiA family prenyltransferase [Beijerinckiaceae bacterium]